MARGCFAPGARWPRRFLENFLYVEEISERILLLLDVEALRFEKEPHSPKEEKSPIFRPRDLRQAIELIAQVLSPQAGKEERDPRVA